MAAVAAGSRRLLLRLSARSAATSLAGWWPPGGSSTAATRTSRASPDAGCSGAYSVAESTHPDVRRQVAGSSLRDLTLLCLACDSSSPPSRTISSKREGRRRPRDRMTHSIGLAGDSSARDLGHGTPRLLATPD